VGYCKSSRRMAIIGMRPVIGRVKCLTRQLVYPKRIISNMMDWTVFVSLTLLATKQQ
jgi:hypothetical protein